MNVLSLYANILLLLLLLPNRIVFNIIKHIPRRRRNALKSGTIKNQ